MEDQRRDDEYWKNGEKEIREEAEEKTTEKTEEKTEEKAEEKGEGQEGKVSSPLPLREERAEEILLNNSIPLLSLEEGKGKEGEVVNRKNLLGWLKSLKEERLSPYFRETYRRGKKVATSVPFPFEVKGLSDYSPSEEGRYLSREGEKQYRKALALASLLSPYGRQFGVWDRLSDFCTVISERIRELSFLEGEESREKVRELEEELSAIRLILDRREELLSSFNQYAKSSFKRAISSWKSLDMGISVLGIKVSFVSFYYAATASGEL